MESNAGPEHQTSKLRVTGSNPVGVANKNKGLVFGLGPFSCRSMLQMFSLDSRYFPMLPADCRKLRAT
jgi:hypothetical protein